MPAALSNPASGSQAEFLFPPNRPVEPGAPTLTIDGVIVPLLFVRNRRARRYILRLTPGGAARVTLPWGGSLGEARRFAEGQTAWLGRQLNRRQQRALAPAGWTAGHPVWFRGVAGPLRLTGENGRPGVAFADQQVALRSTSDGLKPAVQRHLWRLARVELPPRVRELAVRHGLTVHRVTVRNQRSRWGSCSRRGTISLNWRLIQTPDAVRDYIILHELMHLRHMNHSARFWRAVASVCPDYRDAERWLKTHRDDLR